MDLSLLAPTIASIASIAGNEAKRYHHRSMPHSAVSEIQLFLNAAGRSAWFTNQGQGGLWSAL